MAREDSPVDTPTTREELSARIDSLPRVRLAHLPTPLDPCPRLAEAIGIRALYIKRDDLTGLAFGGNKTRHLEFVFAEILKSGADTVVAGAYTQSNWCRQITAAARKNGLDVSLVLMHGEKGPALQGNLLLDRLMGADVTVVDLESMEKIQPLLDEKARALEAAGKRPFVIEPFLLDHQVLAAIGYVMTALELDAQFDALGIDPGHVYICGANITPAGLIVGLRALGRRARVGAISPIKWEEDRATDIARIVGATARKLDLNLSVSDDDFIADEGYIGEIYGRISPEGRAALRLVAETEGIFLDPVYSAKAMAGLIDHIKRGIIGPDETVVFVHTGGTPALFAYADDLIDG
jgi:1-aminocyclopropane-1-carboxylate deaminase/D-cysteine desulfhydrase-like pyridoxal-dependent ACC family enzyme